MSTAATGRPSFGFGHDNQDAKKATLRQKLSRSILGLMVSMAVLAGLGMTLSPAAGMRRLGSMILVAWAGLWVAGAASLVMEVQSDEMIIITAVSGMIFLCTLIRGCRLWSSKRGRKAKG